MGRASASVCVVGLAGCAQLFGIDNTSAPADVALPAGATVTLSRVMFGATIAVEPANLTGHTATYYIADDTETSGLRAIPTTAAGNVWTGDVPDGVPASVDITVPDPGAPRRFYAFPNRDLLLQYGVYTQGADAPANAMLTVSVTLPTPYADGDSFQMYAVGPWATHALTEGLPAINTGATTIGPATVMYTQSSFPSAVQARPLPALTTADRMVVLRYNGGGLIQAAEATPFAQTGNDMVTTTLVPNAQTPLDVTLAPMALATRMGMSSPVGGGAGLAWQVHAAPGYRYANGTGPMLRSGGIVATDATATITAPYGNPFAGLGWNAFFSFNGSRGRTYTPPALALPVGLATGVVQSFEPTGPMTIDIQAGLPVLVLVNDMPLTSDGLTLTVDPNKAVKLGMVADKTTNTFYQFTLHELVPNAAMTALELKNVFTAVAPGPDVTIPQGVLTTGKTYAIRAYCYRGGFPGVSMGDFTQRDLPLSVGYHDSGVFTVAAP
jgi:hypothetical protein